MNIRIREIREGCMPKPTMNEKGAVIGDAIDLVSAEDIYIQAGCRAKIRLGVAIQVPSDYSVILVARSSTCDKFHIVQTNGIGLVDNSYCGNNDELSMPVLAIQNTHIPKGTRVCQIFCVPRYEYTLEQVDDLGNADRGGFGTTGTTKF